ncbi:hypothetical protein GCM10018954_083040 [Kutzneria kofuensis]
MVRVWYCGREHSRSVSVGVMTTSSHCRFAAIVALSIAMVAGFTFGLRSAPAQAATPAAADTYYYSLIARHSGKCLDVWDGSTDDHALVQQFGCHYGNNQQFGLVYVTGDYYALVARHSGKCLDIPGASLDDHVIVQQYGCHYGENQQFRLVRIAGNYYSLVARNSGKCLDVWAGSTDDHALVQQYGCHYGDNQQFYFRYMGVG